MNESEIPIVSGEATSSPPSRPRRRAPARPKTATRRKAARRPPASARKVPAARPAAARSAELQAMLQALARRAVRARGRLAQASGSGAQATRRAWRTVSGASRKTIERLTSEWKQLDRAKKAQFVAALLTALAAASAPLVRRGLKKR